MRVEKRLNFGFKGEWGKVYKFWAYAEKPINESITYERSTYVDIGCDVQFKYIESGVDKIESIAQPIANLPTNAEFRLAKTGDAYFNRQTNNFECVVAVTDIVKVFGCYWVVEKIEEKSIFTPTKQTVFYLSLRKVFAEIIENQKGE